ncbi:MAG: hypothetical protein QXP98_04255 [Thermoproteus sp.]
MADLAPEDLLQDVLRELVEMRRSLSALSKQIADIAARVEKAQQQPPPPPPAPPSVEVPVSRIQEAADRINAVLQKAVEELSYQREVLMEELRRRDALCESLLERIAALQAELERLRAIQSK